MNFRSWQRWQLIEYALLQKISEEKAVENGRAIPPMYLLMTQKHTRPFRMTEALGTLESTMAAVCSEQ